MASKPKRIPLDKPLMSRAVAVWLVENTSLTFDQVAAFCGMHRLEVQGIADGEVAAGVRGRDPVADRQITREEIDAGQADPDHVLRLADNSLPAPVRRTAGPRYTPIAKRQDKPDAIAWLVRAHPDLRDAQIIRLIGTTKTTIRSIRDRTHWNAANLRPRDPVLLGLCVQSDLNHEVERARLAAGREPGEDGAAAEPTEGSALEGAAGAPGGEGAGGAAAGAPGAPGAGAGEGEEAGRPFAAREPTAAEVFGEPDPDPAPAS